MVRVTTQSEVQLSLLLVYLENWTSSEQTAGRQMMDGSSVEGDEQLLWQETY